MQRISLPLPTMYGDHHVLEVRRLLLAMTGVEDVYASSAFHTVEVTYDPSILEPESIQAALAEAGYSEQLAVPTETIHSYRPEDPVKSTFRHTMSYQQLSTTVSFAQTTNSVGRALWPCPGMGLIKAKIIEDDVGYG